MDRLHIIHLLLMGQFLAYEVQFPLYVYLKYLNL